MSQPEVLLKFPSAAGARMARPAAPGISARRQWVRLACFFKYFGARRIILDCHAAAENAGLDLRAEWMEHRGARGYIISQIGRMLDELQKNPAAFGYLEQWAFRKLAQARSENDPVNWHFILAAMWGKRSEMVGCPAKKEACQEAAATHYRAARLMDEAWKHELNAAELERQPRMRWRLLKKACRHFVAAWEQTERLAQEAGVDPELKPRMAAYLALLAGTLAALDAYHFGHLPDQPAMEQLAAIRRLMN